MRKKKVTKEEVREIVMNLLHDKIAKIAGTVAADDILYNKYDGEENYWTAYVEPELTLFLGDYWDGMNWEIVTDALVMGLSGLIADYQRWTSTEPESLVWRIRVDRVVQSCENLTGCKRQIFCKSCRERYACPGMRFFVLNIENSWRAK